ncbi:hypothetical protein [Wocania ichthyoenteri]|nr:hypothetical protein [Wocania ichthyoenteri]
MKFNLIVIFILIFQFVSAQEKTSEFKIELIKKEKSEFKTDYAAFEHRFENFYEDEYFIVRDSCRGEFGGTIEFKNKETGKKYIAKATCPSSIVKLNGKYYLTTSLAHMSGFSEIYEISNPHKLEELNMTDSVKEKYLKGKSTKGLKQLYKNIGGTILVSFPFENELYHISTHKDGTYLSKRQGSELMKLKQLLDYKVFTFESGIKITAENHYLNNFITGRYEVIGFFDVFENVIRINIYE